MTRKEYEKKIAALEPLDNEKRKRVTCSLLGHSHITTGCFGYVYCARCGEQIGDVLGGCFYDPMEVRVGHNCPTCRANYEKLGWEDKILTPDPFSDKNSGGAQ
ncbi:hypothetical protein H7U40_18125 [Flavonifractor plautii]|uniref:hypothetical protein n=1 Tax=Flavonifractor plautii TaxID=292800 RepID=UPI00195B2646|nr:hypothetical protein [Flavonifractor plautii]MBM6792166.1 hypothetical protein [Flavonifractor plautii]